MKNHPSRQSGLRKALAIAVAALAFAVSAAHAQVTEKSDDFSITYGGGHPVVEGFDGPERDATNQDPFSVTVIFSESVQLDDGALLAANIVNGILFDVIPGDSFADEIELVIEPDQPNPPGENDFDIEITIPEGAFVSESTGNPNEESTPYIVTFDDRPVEIIGITSPEDPGPTNADEFDITVAFNKPVFDFEFSDIAISGDADVSFSGTEFVDEQSAFTFTVLHGDDGELVLDIAAGVTEDAAGNLNEASQTYSIVLDRSPPEFVEAIFLDTLDNEIQSPTNLYQFELEIVFDQNLDGATFEDDHLEITSSNPEVGTDILEFAVVSMDRVSLEFMIPETDREAITDFGFTINPGLIADFAGNEFAGTETFSITYNGTRPTVALSSAHEVTTLPAIPVTIQFSEPVVDFSASDIDVVNGVADAGSLTDQGNGEFDVDIIPADTDPGQIYNIIVSIPEAAAEDLAGNPSLASTEDLVITFDTTPPSVVISSDEVAEFDGELFTNAAAIPITITFSKPVFGFDAFDLVINNATFSNFSGGDGDTEFTLDIDPPPGSGPEVITLDVPAGAAEDKDGNENEAADQFVVNWDQTRPQPVVSTTAPATTNASPIPVSIDFGKVIREFTVAMAESAVSAEQGSAFSIEELSTADDEVFTFDLVPAASDVFTIELAETVVLDRPGNLNEASNTLTVTFDSEQPVIAFHAVEAGGVVSDDPIADPTNVDALTLFIDFSEPVSGFGLADIDEDNAMLSDFTEVDVDEGLYSVRVEVVDDGEITLIIAGGAVQDAAGNDNLEGVFVIESDRTPPQIQDITAQIDPAPINPGFTNVSAFELVLTFSEELADFDVDDLVVNNASVSLAGHDNNREFTVEVLADSVSTTSHTVSIEVPQGVFVDLAGNPLANADTFAIEFGDIRPTAEFTTTASAPANQIPVPVTLTVNEIFAEPVSGFDVDAIVTENVASIEWVGGTNPVFELEVTPAGTGVFEIGLTLEEGAVIDAAGNPNEASEMFSLEVMEGDDAHPVPTHDLAGLVLLSLLMILLTAMVGPGRSRSATMASCTSTISLNSAARDRHD